MKPLPSPNASSILSFPERGPWGNPHYPGNSSGYVLLELLAALKPTFIIDVTAAGGTNVARGHEYGIRVLGFDLKGGFNSYLAALITRLLRNEYHDLHISRSCEDVVLDGFTSFDEAV